MYPLVFTMATDLDHSGDVGRGAGEVAEGSRTPALGRYLHFVPHRQGDDGRHRTSLHDPLLCRKVAMKDKRR